MKYLLPILFLFALVPQAHATTVQVEVMGAGGGGGGLTGGTPAGGGGSSSFNGTIIAGGGGGAGARGTQPPGGGGGGGYAIKNAQSVSSGVGYTYNSFVDWNFYGAFSYFLKGASSTIGSFLPSALTFSAGQVLYYQAGTSTASISATSTACTLYVTETI